MISKWIKDLTYALFYQDRGNPDEILEDIDNLLKRAANETDNEQLHDEIMSKIRNDSV